MVSAALGGYFRKLAVGHVQSREQTSRLALDFDFSRRHVPETDLTLLGENLHLVADRGFFIPEASQSMLDHDRMRVGVNEVP